MKSKKIVVMIMASSNPSYSNLENAIKETWYNLKNDLVEIIFYSDNQYELEKKNHTIFDGCKLILPCNDGVHNCGLKTILAFEWLLKNYEFDYVYRSNLGAFVYPNNLLKFVENKDLLNFYCGIIGNDTYWTGRNVRFASGSGYFLSNNLVKLLVDNKSEFNHNIVDDVALGSFLQNKGISICESAVRYNICDNKKFIQIGEQQVENIDDDKIYHIRLRSDDRNLDIRNMKILYNEFIKNNLTQ